MTDRLSLRRSHAELVATIRASEEWHPSYKATPKQFRALVKAEAELQNMAGEYLYNLSQRAHLYVDWSEYARELAKQPAIKAASIHAEAVANASDEVWKGEALDLQRHVIEAIELIMAIGVDAALERYELPLYVDSVRDFVATAAQKHVAGLVSGVTETTRGKIRTSIQQSLSRGEKTQQAMERIQQVINNPVRAEMIAQTESVNAWSQGQFNYAKETGAKRKIWEALAGACKQCAPLDGEKVEIDEPFSSGVMLPAQHPRCRCSCWYEY
ncbi:phage minor head protein [Dietzia maris]|uniref:phage minor head protein n=1 Tax=Dietzia maris TaxID=37915 RepID=UPI0037C625A7